MVLAGFGALLLRTLFATSARNGDPMDVAGLANDRIARPAVAGRPHGSPNRNARRPGAGAARPEPTRVSPLPAPSDRPADVVDPSGAPDTADQLQADYFLQMLTSRRRLIDRRIDEYHKAVAASEAGGDLEKAGDYRRMTRIEEHDRQTLDAMIDKLHRRFPRPSPADAPALSPRARFVAR